MRESARIVLRGGLVAGLIGYVTVVLLFSAFNVATGKSLFYTAALLGSALFYGGEEAAGPGPVLAYNGAHMVAFLLLGMLASWLVWLAERFPIAQYVFLFVLIFVGFHVYVGLTLYAMPLLGSSAWWEIGVPSVVAAALMGSYLIGSRPVLRAELRDLPWGEVPFDEPRR